MANERPGEMLQPDRTLPVSLIFGVRLKYTFICLIAVLYIVPWRWLYGLPVYRSFVDFMATIFPKIVSIPGTPSQFPEYAMALLSFVHAVGVGFVAFYLVYGVIHARAIDLSMISRARVRTKIWMAVGYPMFFVLFASAPFVWNGHSFHLPTLFYESKAAFVVMTVALWTAILASAFSTTCYYASLISLWRHK